MGGYASKKGLWQKNAIMLIKISNNQKQEK